MQLYFSPPSMPHSSVFQWLCLQKVQIILGSAVPFLSGGILITARLACKKVERGKLLCTKCRTSHWTRGLFSYQMSLHQVVQKENMQQILRNNVNSRYPLHVHFNSSSAMAVQVILYGDTFLTQSVVTPLSTWLPISRSVKKKRSD